MKRMLWTGARIATCDDSMHEIDRGAIVSLGGKIEWVGAEEQLPEHHRAIESHDLGRKWITPAWIDCHTHLVFAGTRAQEWNQLLSGATYEQIARAGGGILSTVKATRAASEAELLTQAGARLQTLLREGVTTVEVKSGYGLTLADERKMLRVARQLAAQYPVCIKTTFLGAHSLPPEFAGRTDDYIATITDEWLPTLHDEGLVDAVDIFCENIAFNLRHAERLFDAATKLKLPLRMHAEQLSNIGASQLAARFGALSCDHLEFTTEDDMRAMKEGGSVAVLLPTAYLHLNMTQLPLIDALRRQGVPMAIASDCNPGSSPSPSLHLAAALATRLFKLTPSEALAGVTRHAARAVGESNRGVLRAGNVADFAIWDVATLDEIPYWIGRNTCVGVVRGGVLTQF